jgi:hydrogenase maturation protease
MSSKPIHVVGLGNTLHGDDGVGVRAVEHIRARGEAPEGVELIDGGTSVFDVLGALGGGGTLVVIDAVEGGGTPGTVYRIPYAEMAGEGRNGALSVHETGLLEALPLLELGGVRWEEVVLIGVEPETLAFGAGLSARVESALPAVAAAVEREVRGARAD